MLFCSPLTAGVVGRPQRSTSPPFHSLCSSRWIMSCHAMLCHVVLNNLLSSWIMSGWIISCWLMPCRVGSYFDHVMAMSIMEHLISCFYLVASRHVELCPVRSSARVAQVEWAKTSFAERKRVLVCLQNYILDNQDDIARVASRDSGKPRKPPPIPFIYFSNTAGPR